MKDLRWMQKRIYQEFLPRWIPTRVLICLMTFTACWTSYMCRLQMPILVVPMIKAVEVNTTKESLKIGPVVNLFDPLSHLDHQVLEAHMAMEKESLEHARYPRDTSAVREARPEGITLFDGRPFAWEPWIRGQLIASYSYGNVPGNFLGGVMSLRYGPRRAILWTSLLAGVVSLVSPLLAQMHWGLLAVSRAIIGLTGGVTFPACHTMVAKWAPPNEKSRFVWSLLGGTFGTIFTYPMIAAIAANVNWESAWYIPSLLMFVWIFFWAAIAYDSPAEHPGISEEEKEYILSSQAGTVLARKPTMKETPVMKIFTSIPFICLVISHFGNMFLIFFYQNTMMLFLTRALGFELTKGGAAAATPWGGRMLFGFFFSWTGDMIKRKKIISITLLRKGASLFSHFIPGLFLIAVGYVGRSFLLANVFLFLALGFNGAASISNLSNNQDLSPNFAGYLYGIMNTVGCTAGIIISPLVEEIAGKYGNPIDKWQILFWIGAAVVILCMAVFCIGGSGEIQPWNEIQPQGGGAGAGTAAGGTAQEAKT